MPTPAKPLAAPPSARTVQARRAQFVEDTASACWWTAWALATRPDVVPLAPLHLLAKAGFPKDAPRDLHALACTLPAIALLRWLCAAPMSSNRPHYCNALLHLSANGAWPEDFPLGGEAMGFLAAATAPAVDDLRLPKNLCRALRTSPALDEDHVERACSALCSPPPSWLPPADIPQLRSHALVAVTLLAPPQANQVDRLLAASMAPYDQASRLLLSAMDTLRDFTTPRGPVFEQAQPASSLARLVHPRHLPSMLEAIADGLAHARSPMLARYPVDTVQSARGNAVLGMFLETLHQELPGWGVGAWTGVGYDFVKASGNLAATLRKVQRGVLANSSLPNLDTWQYTTLSETAEALSETAAAMHSRHALSREAATQAPRRRS